MDSIKFVDLFSVDNEGFGYSTSNVLLLATATWLLVFATQMALRTSLACLYYSSVAGDLSFLPFSGRVGVVVCYMPLK
jgi:hypothetical protein